MAFIEVDDYGNTVFQASTQQALEWCFHNPDMHPRKVVSPPDTVLDENAIRVYCALRTESEEAVPTDVLMAALLAEKMGYNVTAPILVTTDLDSGEVVLTVRLRDGSCLVSQEFTIRTEYQRAFDSYFYSRANRIDYTASIDGDFTYTGPGAIDPIAGGVWELSNGKPIRIQVLSITRGSPLYRLEITDPIKNSLEVEWEGRR